MKLIRHVIRFFVAAIVLLLIAAIVPGFQLNHFWSAFFAAIVIALFCWALEKIFGEDISPYARGVIGFFVSAAVIYLTQFFINGMKVSLVGALMAALVIGIVDLFVPIKGKFKASAE
ncbi:phage holin family protein [Mechercharimyces sp. CAU 1602]|uniref:phage holin family protein n=1 Tax=Mechercharimyces sp. CAU 1602 TaxID=2973933 RepID=UPI0021611EB1|nr:phage holin family protein [Mechercharimyces sp. CAU 1602]MCS1351544.1 phage holin family protein [Mechercharimyces sp. CAU 1602]